MRGADGSNTSYSMGYGGTQTSGGTIYDHGVSGASFVNGSFGKGGDVTKGNGYLLCGGGGGWYGGGPSNEGGSGGGSGYIYNSASESLYPSGKLVNSSYYLSNAGMYQYSVGCTTSSDTATKTTCTSSYGAHTANAANTGNGYARITYLGT